MTELRFPASGTYPQYDYGAWDVAIAANGIAIASTFGGALRQINLQTNTITVRNDIPGRVVTPYYTERIAGELRVSRTPDGKHLLIGDRTIYDAATNTFSPLTAGGRPKAAINRDGTLLASGFFFSDSLETTQGYDLRHIFSQMGGGVAFDPTNDTFYGTSEVENAIIAYDSNTYAEKFRLAVGEPIFSVEAPFETELTVSPDGKYMALATVSGIRVFQIFPAPPASAPPVLRYPRDLVFDHAGKNLYIGTADGFLWRYGLVSKELEASYNLGGILKGMDIAADDSFLLAAQYYRGLRQSTYHKVDLQTGIVANLNYELRTDVGLEQGSWDVAIASNGRAFASPHNGGGSGFTFLREINLTTGEFTFRNDVPEALGAGPAGATQLVRSADRTSLVIPVSNISSGPIFSYDAATDTFRPKVEERRFWDQTPVAVNRNGSLIAFDSNLGTGGVIQKVSDFSTVHVFPEIKGTVAFDAVSDTLYGIRTSPTASAQLIAYDTNTFAENFRLNIGEFLDYPSEQFFAGNFVASQDGRYLALITSTTVRLVDIANRTVTPLPTPAPLPVSPHGRLANISTRARVGAGDAAVIGGFILTGSVSKKLIVRAIGPSLTGFGVENALQDPVLDLYDTTGVLAAHNDNWKDSQQAAVALSRLAPENDREAAIVATLAPGGYTAVVRGKDGTSGVALVEVYDLEPGSDSTFSNISTRGSVGTGDEVMIAGLVVDGSGSKVVVRGIGSSLAQLGVSDSLADPVLELHNQNGFVVAVNDEWQEVQAAEIWNSGLSPLDNREATILATLPPGSYTAILRGKQNTSGIGLVEAYALP